MLVEGINVVKQASASRTRTRCAGWHRRAGSVRSRFQRDAVQPATGKGDRVGIKTLEDGRKVRFFKSNNEVVDV